jgi:type I restriction enzyme S subunit
VSARELITEHLDLWTGAVTKKSSSGRGSSGKVVLTGVKKLRALILELAIRGQLLETQNVASEEVSENNEVTKRKVGNEDYPFLKPRNWSFAKFIDVLDFQGGSQPPKNMFSQEQRDGYVQLLQIRDLGPNPQPVYVPEESVSKFCTAEDILIGRYGASVGKVFWGKPGAYNVALIKLINSHGLYVPAFLFHLMASPYGQSLFVGISRSAQSGFSKKDIANRVLPLPPLADQHYIVQKVDELMALCDRLEQQTSDQLEAHETLVDTLLGTLTQSENTTELADNWARLATHFDTLFTTEQSIDKLKQTILQLAVMGRLVEQLSSDAPAFMLLKSIEETKEMLVADRKIKKSKILPPVLAEEEPYRVPKGWTWSRVGSVALFTEYGTSVKTLGSIIGIPVLKMGDIQEGRILIGGQKHAPKTTEGIQDLLLKHGDLLYNRTNSAELVGKTGVFKGSDDILSFASYLIRIKVESRLLSPDFLNMSMNSPLFRETEINPHLKQQCGQANVNGTILKQMRVPLPPREEQTRIVQKFDELMAFCDQLKERLNQASETRCQLAEAVVEGALN